MKRLCLLSVAARRTQNVHTAEPGAGAVCGQRASRPSAHGEPLLARCGEPSHTSLEPRETVGRSEGQSEQWGEAEKESGQ